jgi:hypothetical protein
VKKACYQTFPVEEIQQPCQLPDRYGKTMKEEVFGGGIIYFG